MTDEGASYGLVLSFGGLDFGETTEHAFVHGFELGQIWQRMESGAEAEIEVTIHTINVEALRRAAAADGWSIDVRTTEIDEWSRATMTKGKSLDRANPHGLRVVS